MKIFPVVHVNEVGVAVRQAELALTAGADGVYLIDHKTPSNIPTMEVFYRLRSLNPDSFIGVNFLNDTPAQALEFLYQTVEYSANLRETLPNALWADDCSVSRRSTQALREARPELTELVTYAGGVAFKYTSGYTSDPAGAAEQARSSAGGIDIVVTSGAGTGSSPGSDKIDRIKDAIGDKPLAIASGVSLDNLALFSSADQVFVSTSIEAFPGSGVFNVGALNRMVEMVHSL